MKTVPGGATAYMMQKVIEEQNGFHWLDCAPRTLAAKEHRPAYGSDGDYFSKPNREQIFEAVYEIMHEANPIRWKSRSLCDRTSAGQSETSRHTYFDCAGLPGLSAAARYCRTPPLRQPLILAQFALRGFYIRAQRADPHVGEPRSLLRWRA